MSEPRIPNDLCLGPHRLDDTLQIFERSGQWFLSNLTRRTQLPAIWLADFPGFSGVMSKIKTTRFDISRHLRTPEEMAAYLEACMEEANGDAAFIAKASGDIARAKGMTQVARDAVSSLVSVLNVRQKPVAYCAFFSYAPPRRVP